MILDSSLLFWATLYSRGKTRTIDKITTGNDSDDDGDEESERGRRRKTRWKDDAEKKWIRQKRSGEVSLCFSCISFSQLLFRFRSVLCRRFWRLKMNIKLADLRCLEFDAFPLHGLDQSQSFLFQQTLRRPQFVLLLTQSPLLLIIIIIIIRMYRIFASYSLRCSE